jgi:NADH:ubiquinone oxidoreductase subunit E
LLLTELDAHKESEMEASRRTLISICMGSSCFARGNNRTLQVLREYLRTRQLEDQVDVKGLLCGGGCSQGPNLVIDGMAYHAVQPAALVELLDHHFRPGSAG